MNEAMSKWFIEDYGDWKAVASQEDDHWIVAIYENGKPENLRKQYNFYNENLTQERAIARAIERFRGEDVTHPCR